MQFYAKVPQFAIISLRTLVLVVIYWNIKGIADRPVYCHRKNMILLTTVTFMFLAVLTDAWSVISDTSYL